jgi:hypothetical protein
VPKRVLEPPDDSSAVRGNSSAFITFLAQRRDSGSTNNHLYLGARNCLEFVSASFAGLVAIMLCPELDALTQVRELAAVNSAPDYHLSKINQLTP